MSDDGGGVGTSVSIESDTATAIDTLQQQSLNTDQGRGAMELYTNVPNNNSSGGGAGNNRDNTHAAGPHDYGSAE